MIIEPKFIDKTWPHVWPLIKELVVLETEENLKLDLYQARRFLLVFGDGVAIIRPCDGFLEINYVGGSNIKDWWGDMSEAIDKAAKSFGLDKIVAFGRSAWKRIAPDYTPTDTRMYIKEVA